MDLPPRLDPSALKSSLFASPDARRARAERTRLPKGHLSPETGRDQDVYVANQGSSPMDGSTLQAVDLQSGRQRWEAHLVCDLIVSPVPSADKSTVWASGEAVIGAFSADSGEPRGTWGTGTRKCLNPVPLEEDRVVLSDWKDGFLAVLEPGRTQPVWETRVGPVYGDPVAAPGRVLASVYNGWQADAGGVVVALDARTGEPVWRHESSSPVHTSPAVADDGTVVVAGDHGQMTALDPDSGRTLWQVQLGGRPAAPPTFSPDGERLYLADRSGSLVALDADTGNLEWKMQAPSGLTQAPAVAADGTLCQLAEGPQALLVDPEKGTLTAQVDLEGVLVTRPIPLPDGSFLVRSAAGESWRVSAPPDLKPGSEPPALQPSPEIRVGEAEVSIGGVTLPRR